MEPVLVVEGELLVEGELSGKAMKGVLAVEGVLSSLAVLDVDSDRSSVWFVCGRRSTVLLTTLCLTGSSVIIILQLPKQIKTENGKEKFHRKL